MQRPGLMESPGEATFVTDAGSTIVEADADWLMFLGLGIQAVTAEVLEATLAAGHLSEDRAQRIVGLAARLTHAGRALHETMIEGKPPTYPFGRRRFHKGMGSPSLRKPGEPT